MLIRKKNIWKIINEVTGLKSNRYVIKRVCNNDNLVENYKDICYVFNFFFSSILKTILNRMASKKNIWKIRDTDFSNPVNKSIIEQQINKIRTKSS